MLLQDPELGTSVKGGVFLLMPRGLEGGHALALEQVGL